MTNKTYDSPTTRVTLARIEELAMLEEERVGKEKSKPLHRDSITDLHFVN